jgi:hypothetical protein
MSTPTSNPFSTIISPSTGPKLAKVSRTLSTHTWDLSELSKTPSACLTFPLLVSFPGPDDPDDPDNPDKNFAKTVLNQRVLDYILDRVYKRTFRTDKKRLNREFGDPGIRKEKILGYEVVERKQCVGIRGSEGKKPVLEGASGSFEQMYGRFEAFGDGGKRVVLEKCCVCGRESWSCGHMVFRGVERG